MVERRPDPPRLNAIQRLWLHELGLDRPMLARLARGDAPAKAGAGGAMAADAGASDGAASGAAASGAAASGAAAPSAAAVLSASGADGVPVVSGASPAGAGSSVSRAPARGDRSQALQALAALRQGGERGPAAHQRGALKPGGDMPPGAGEPPMAVPRGGADVLRRDAATTNTAASNTTASDAAIENTAAADTASDTRIAAPGDVRADAMPRRDISAEGAASPAWAALEAGILACEACGLHAGRHSAVPGTGALEAVDWLVVGEAPGEWDDRAGRPFQGKAGELLHAMLAAAGIDAGRAVFYTNAVKCRPRSNRPPTAEEIAACLPHLHRQIALLRPRGILALGRLAAQALLGGSGSLEQRRGRVHTFESGGREIPLVVTYHPASLLSQPRRKAASWRDLNLARTV